MYLLLAAIPVLAIGLFLMKGRKVVKLPPGPVPRFFFGNYLELDKANVHQSLHKLADKYGPVSYLKILQRNIVVLNSPDVLRKAFHSEEYREKLNDKPKGFFGTYILFGHRDVLFGPYSDLTFKLKAVMHRGLEPAMREEQIGNEAKVLVAGFKDKQGVDFSPREMVEMLLADVFSNIISGDPQPGDTNLMWDFIHMNNKLLNPSVEGLLKNLPMLRHLPINIGHMYRAALDSRDRLLNRFLDEYRVTYDPKVHRGLVDTCLTIQQTEKNPDGQPWLSDDMIRALVIDSIGAGLVATTNSILSVLLNILHDKECRDKMFTEIQTVLGRNKMPTGSDVKRLPYCYAVYLESARFSTVVPIVNHYCSTEDVEFDGYTIPKDTMVWGNFWTSHHAQDVWGDPWVFRPDRFLDNQGRILPSDHTLMISLMQYGVGSRNCVGGKFAKIRVFVYIVALLQNFDIIPPVNEELLSNDPRLMSGGAVLEVPVFKCRALERT